jgi:succinate dehydrogenase/fumarate reductase flavoprotein subunit
VPRHWDSEADVIVVGFGAAGMAAAVTAFDLGAEVIILEKAPEGQEGGNTRVAGQGYLNTSSVESAIAYMTALCGPYTVPETMIRVWAEEMGQNNDWLRGLGGDPQGSSSRICRGPTASTSSMTGRPTAIPILGSCSSGWCGNARSAYCTRRRARS